MSQPKEDANASSHWHRRFDRFDRPGIAIAAFVASLLLVAFAITTFPIGQSPALSFISRSYSPVVLPSFGGATWSIFKQRRPKRLFINFARNCCQRSQVLSCQTALEFGADRCIAYNESALDPVWMARNDGILSQQRGAGYWLWKPYVILKTLLEEMDDGDLLLYGDSGAHSIGDLGPLYDLADATKLCNESESTTKNTATIATEAAAPSPAAAAAPAAAGKGCAPPEQEVHLFTYLEECIEACWTKMDAFLLLHCPPQDCANSTQVNAAFSVWRRGPQAIRFAAQWLGYMEDYRVSTDAPNELGKSNLECFQDHRHDQSTLSLLGKRWGLHMYDHPHIVGRFLNWRWKE